MARVMAQAVVRVLELAIQEVDMGVLVVEVPLAIQAGTHMGQYLSPWIWAVVEVLRLAQVEA
jgi:uncharacterized Fe-S cluster-containing MiaB family protein